jgi:exodeoxyribonuclease III
VDLIIIVKIRDCCQPYTFAIAIKPILVENLKRMKLITWNVNGIRAVCKKGFWDWFETELPDAVCLQEIKADDEVMTKWWADTLKGFGVENNSSVILSGAKDPVRASDIFEELESKIAPAQGLAAKLTGVQSTEEVSNPPDWIFGSAQDDGHIFDSNPKPHFLSNYKIIWHACSIKKGYSGTAIIYKKSLDAKALAGIGKSKFDDEGRTTILQIKGIVLINCYYPQGGRPERIPFKLEFYEEMIALVNNYKNLGKKVIICGDLNTTVTDIDLARPKENRKTTGCLPEEREVLDRLIKAVGVDSFRHLYPDTVDKYTYWDQITRARDRNVGWRIDYMIVDERLVDNIKEVTHLETIMGSDHCGVKLEIEF